MSDDEIAGFIERSRTATMADRASRTGRPHLVAMWYAVVDGEIWFETKAKSQKAVNLRRDPTITVMIEDGQSYDTLRGCRSTARPRSSTTRKPFCALGQRVGAATPGRTDDDAPVQSTR